jgi:hypothetical protein
VEKFKREYAEKLNREEYAKELKQMRSVSSLLLLFIVLSSYLCQYKWIWNKRKGSLFVHIYDTR